MSGTRKAVAVLFGGSHHKYHYFCDFDVKVGDNVIVDTKRGEATVIVVEVMGESAAATAHVKRMA